MPCVSKFKNSLEKHNVSEEIQREINEGYEGIQDSTDPRIRGTFFKRAVGLLNAKVDKDKVKEIFEEGSCCKGGARLKASKEFAKANADKTLEEKLTLIPKVPYMGIPKLNDDGTLTIIAVQYYFDNLFHCACSNFNKFKEIEVSKNYCYCCGGHFKFHYEIMLCKKLEIIEVVSSPLDSKGQNACVFKMRII